MFIEKATFDVSLTGPDDDVTHRSIFRKCFPYRSTDSDILPSWPKRIGLFAFGVVQNGLAGGLIFGWASIDQSLLSEKPENGGVGLDLQQTTRIFSWATSISMVAALILGAVLDHSGPRLASMISCLTISAGCLIFALSKHMFGIAVGTILIGFGGPGVGNCIIHLANLFPGNENLAMSCLSGSIALSFSMFAFFDMAWTGYEDVTFRGLFGGYAVLHFVLAIGAVILYPDEPYEQLIDDDTFQDVMNEIDMEVRPLLPESQSIIDGISSKTVPVPKEGHHDLRAHHKHSGHAPPHVSLMVEQPFNSYLRDKQRMVERTDSFVASAKSLASGGPVMSLKDLPLFDQLASASYQRAFLVFLVTTFVTNFYVATLSTELKDRQDFSAETRHELSKWFTMMMSMGIFGSFLVGWLIDRVGLEICTALTLLFGQLQMLLIILGSQSKTLMILSFAAYTAFRAFLYPVFIGSLTSRLGFKYFGILLGLGFALSGMAQLLFPVLVLWFQGDCHLLTDRINHEGAVATTCDHGMWQSSEILQFIVLGLMHVVPLLDYRDRVTRDVKIKQMLMPNSSNPSYGSRNGMEHPYTDETLQEMSGKMT